MDVGMQQAGTLLLVAPTSPGFPPVLLRLLPTTLCPMPTLTLGPPFIGCLRDISLKVRVSCYTGAIVGGNYDNGLSDGAFALNANNALSNANANIGASIS